MRSFVVAALVAVLFVSDVAAQPTVFQGSGNITTAITQFRAALSDPLNGAATGEQGAGRREINWDGVPGGSTNVDTFPFSFFNTSSTRGAILSTPGNGFRVSDNDFSDVNSAYDAQFDAFSTAKTFSPVGSNTLDVTFHVAGSATGAAVTGFGAVFSDVDVAGATRMEFFQGGEMLGVFDVPVRSTGSSHSFLGVTYSRKRITRVRIILGQGALDAATNDISDGGSIDLVVLDDFLYGEPRADGDTDGVLSSVDTLTPSDTRATVDVKSSRNGQTRLVNVTLATGETIQDIIETCRDSNTSAKNIRKCFKNRISALRRSNTLFEDQRSLLEDAEKKLSKR